MTKQELHQAIEAVCGDRLRRHGIYVEVPTLLFVGKDVAPCPLKMDFFAFNHEQKMTPLHCKHPVCTLGELRQNASLWIREDSLPLVRSYAEDLLLAPDETATGIPVIQRMDILRRSAITVVEDLFETPSRESIAKGGKIVGSFVKILHKDPIAYLDLARLSSHDHYTLQHSVGTSLNSIVLAKKIGLPESELQDIGLAGLLHDIGKVYVDRAIINKTGPLSESEWAEMKKHPAYGYEIVKDHPAMSENSKRAILEHHEDRVGSGYPAALKAEQLGPYSALISLCDVFNALTTDRSYSKARTAFDAFELIRDKMQHKVEPEMFTALVNIYGGKL